MTARRRERGFALLAVLLALGLLALITAAISATARQQARLAANLQAGVAAEAMADGTVRTAVFELLAGHWQPGERRALSRPGGIVRLAITRERERINPNFFNPALMTSVLVSLGADPLRAATITAAMQKWRSGWIHQDADYVAAGLPWLPTGERFRDLDEVGLVLGMTPALFAALRPHLSLYGDAQLRPWVADPLIAQALLVIAPPRLPGAAPAGDARGGEAADGGRLPVVGIVAVAELKGGGRFVRHAIVQLGPFDALPPFAVLAWDAGGDE